MGRVRGRRPQRASRPTQARIPTKTISFRMSAHRATGSTDFPTLSVALQAVRQLAEG